MLDQTQIDQIAQQVAEGRASLTYIDSADRKSWIQSEEGKIDSLVTHDEAVTIIRTVNAASRGAHQE
jgi:hypothetical protein